MLKMNYVLKENFRWLPPGLFKPTDKNENTVAIKGTALYAGAMSRNKRKYVAGEVEKSARTLTGQPITINHDDSRIVGHVELANAEDGNLEYTGYINQYPYVDKIRDMFSMTEEEYFEKWGVYPISGVSIDADYLYNRCPECGDYFTDVDKFNDHVPKVHGIPANFTEPRGIIYKALSLVEPPESPGVDGTTMQLWETEGGMSRLLETVTKVYEEKKKMTSRMAVTREDQHLAFGRSEQKPLTEQEEECPEGQHRNEEGECVDDEVSEQEECPEGQHKNEEGECVDDEVAVEQEEPADASEPCPEGYHHNEEGVCVPDTPVTNEQEDHECPENTHWDAEKEECVADEVTEQEECPTGQHRNEEGECVEDEPVTETAVPKVIKPLGKITLQPVKTEVTELTELQLGEPFADYTDFADCVAKNPDKEDPEAYCASIKSESETAPKPSSKFGQERRALELKQFREQTNKRYMTVRAIIKGYGKDLAGIKEAVSHLAKERLRIIEVSNKIIKTVNQLANRPDNTPTIMKELNRIAEQVNKMITPLTERMNGLPTHFNKQIAVVTLKMTANAKAMAKKLKFLTAKAAASDANAKRKNKQLAKEVSRLNAAAVQEMKGMQKNILHTKSEVLDKIAEVDGKVDAQDKTKAQIVGELNERYMVFKKEHEAKTKELTAKIEEQKKKLDEKDKKTVKETQELTTRFDNLEDKVKNSPQYKGNIKFDTGDPSDRIADDGIGTKPPWKEEAET